MLTQEHIYNYFGIVLHFANKAKVKNLFTRLGYHIEEPTAELCVQATNEYGVEFTQPFGKIAESALESPKYLAHMKVLKAGNAAISTSLNKAKGESLTNEQKVELAGTIIGGISSWIASGQQIADTVVNKDANAANAQAALINAQANANKTNTETQNKWLIPVIIAVVVVLVVGIVAAAVIANKKH